MTNEITAMQTLQDKLKEHTRTKFAEFVPEEVWTEIADRTIKQFIEIDLPQIVKTELREAAKITINSMLQAPDMQSHWENGRYIAKGELKKMLIESAPEMFQSIIREKIFQVMQGAQRY